ncbi:MAG: hypothetical protein ABFD29_12255 [Anaerolineaceae bacterium]
MNHRQPPWYLLTGLLIGLGIGLLLSWLVFPVRYTDASPASLSPAYRDAYRQIIALSYRANGDINRAAARLDLLNDVDQSATLTKQAEEMAANGRDLISARALAQLAADITSFNPTSIQRPDSVAAQTAAPETGQPTLTTTLTLESTRQETSITPTSPPQPTFTPTILPTVQPTLSTPFVLKESQEICDPTLPGSMLQIEVLDKKGEPLPGYQIMVTWDTGEDSFYTGLYPEINLGYADFEMQPNIVYSARVGETGERVSNLSSPECKTTDGESYWGGILLRFSQP